MSWTPITAFAVVVIFFAIGDIIAIKTRGLVSSFLFTVAMIMIFGASMHVLPENLIERLLWSAWALWQRLSPWASPWAP